MDLIREYVVQMSPEKLIIGNIRVDPPEEIMANKLCALLSRSEIRDLVDVRALELAGYKLEDALTAAQAKDRGLPPAQLAWVLSQIEFGSDMIQPGDVSAQELRAYLAELIIRLTKTAYQLPEEPTIENQDGLVRPGKTGFAGINFDRRMIGRIILHKIKQSLRPELWML